MKLSVILFNRKWDVCNDTVESILTKKNKDNIADVIIIERSSENNKSEYIEKLQEKYGSCIKYIESDKTKNILDIALNMATGDFVNITETGIIWNKEVGPELLSVTSKNEYDFFVMSCSHELVIPLYDNTFMRFFEGPQTINVYDKFRMFHIYYPSYFISKKLLETNKINTTSDLLSAMEKMFQMSSKATFAYLMKRGKFTWDECTIVKDFELAFQAKQKELAMFICDMSENITKENFTKNAQYQIVSYLRYFFKFSNKFKEAMSGAEFDLLKESLDRIIKLLDTSMIMMPGVFTAIQKQCLFSKKDDVKVSNMYKDNNEFIYANNEEIVEIEKMSVSINFIDLEEDCIKIEGYLRHTSSNAKIDVFFKVKDKTYNSNILKKDVREFWFDELIGDGVTFESTIDLSNVDEVCNIELWCSCDGVTYQKKKFAFGKYAPLASQYVTSYFDNNGWILSVDDKKGCMHIEKSTKKKVRQKEKAFIKELKEIEDISAKKAVIVRKMYFVMKKFPLRQKWLVSDRINHGDDNGEAFFRALKNKDIKKRVRRKKVYFVIDKDTKEFKELRKFGKTIPTLSWQHKLYHLLSEYVISAQANNPVINIFGVYSRYYKDILCRSKFVFLQHGVIKDDLSEWLNKYNRNIHGFIVTTQAEYQSILDYDYFYDKSRVWLTGIPRYDRLYHAEKKYITFMPTWRKSLTTGADPSTGIWKIRDDFKTSSYYQFYNNILNDERLLKAAKEYGYTLCFMPHPNISHAVNEFDQHEGVMFYDSKKSYRDIFAETNLMLTDYSSVAFDFAYLRKPIIYTQFDRDEFFNGTHSYVEGYYDYEKDGFGEVETEYDKVIDRIIEYMENDCKLKPKYLDRINSTFAYDDKNCSKRIVDLLIDGYKD